jgi:hypothetical protein
MNKEMKVSRVQYSCRYPIYDILRIYEQPRNLENLFSVIDERLHQKSPHYK